MNDVFLGLSPDQLFFHGGKIQNIHELHRPYFLAFPQQNQNTEQIRKQLQQHINDNPDHPLLSKIVDLGPCDVYRSFSDYRIRRTVFPVFTKQSYVVPEVSDYLFFHHDLCTAEHDIPYQQRALTDLAAEETLWLFDTKGKKTPLHVMVYDIETTEFEEGKQDVPIDIIGTAEFTLSITSEKDVSNESFHFDILDAPEDWQGHDIKQVMARNTDEELHQLHEFCKHTKDVDILSGHNILGFDNAQLRNRIQWMIQNKGTSISTQEHKVFDTFLNTHCRLDKSFHFGVGSEVTQWYPCSFDTYLAMRKFYFFLDEFSLKAIAPFLGIHIPNRLYLTPSQMKLDNQTMKYNKHDVQEQLGVTLHLLQLGLPLAFTTCMPFDMLLPAGAVNIWDHMSMIRAKADKKIMPPICRVKTVASALLKEFPKCPTKEAMVKEAKKKPEQLSKDVKRVIKYGEEMPSWVEHPYIIVNPQAKDPEESLGYHMPGGMTIKPDKDVQSHFVPWYYVVVADVGAMYPTILKAMNVGADTVRLAQAGETPDEWVWLKRLPEQLFHKGDVVWKAVSEKDDFADKGYFIGVKIDDQPGVVNRSMSGIMNMIAKIKQELQEKKETGSKAELDRLKMMYQSMKGARNAGSVDYAQRILLVSPQGNLVIKSIGEFVDNLLEKGYRTEIINGMLFELAELRNGWSAISVNKEGTVEIKKIKQVVRHKWADKLVKITTKSGSTVVTPNHSVFTTNQGLLQEVCAGELKENTILAHVEKVPFFKNHTLVTENYREKKNIFNDCIALPPKSIKYVDPTSEYVYDLSVEDNENFVDANGGLILHNTHGILAAPTVTGRQFNLWGAATITTKGQMILFDTLSELKKRNIRVVYGDTDGIYLGCSQSIGNIPALSTAIGVNIHQDSTKWLTKPDDAFDAIADCNKKWRTTLNYPEFELEPEVHDAMLFVKHKNYLIFDTKDGSVDLVTKGNNFKGSDKANIARTVLDSIMMQVLRENPEWDDEEEARKKIRESIVRITQDVLATLDLTKVDLDELTLVQSVQPAKRYKRNMDGAMSTFGKRAEALEKLVGHPIRSRIKMKFVVTKQPLPGIANPSKSGVKPIDFMFPIDHIKNKEDIDLEWYKKMIENFIQGAFGLSGVAATEQTGLDAWM